MDQTPLFAWMADVLGAPVRELRPLGGRNSLVALAVTADGREAVLKRYPAPAEGDGRDRLATEWTALTFLARALPPQAIRTPAPLGANPAIQAALYGYVPGQALSRCADAGDVDQAVAFLAGLRRLGREPAAAGLPVASEAFFHPRDLAANLRRRFGLLLALPPDDPARELARTRLAPALSRFADRARHIEALPPEARQLSPSDLGFHNAVRTVDGLVFFLDFEYFGWDDPTKTLSDFLLHPGMELPAALRLHFARGLLEALEEETPAVQALAPRLLALFPLFGLAWCAIMLNPFLPSGRARWRFAGATGDDEALCAKRLAAAKILLDRLEAWVAADGDGLEPLRRFAALFPDQPADARRNAHA